MEFKYTARVVNEIEVEAKRPFLDAVMTYSMRTVELLVRKGLGMKKEQQTEIWTFIDNYVMESDENSLETLWTECLISLQDAGFLVKKVDPRKMLKELRTPEQENESEMTEPSI